MLERKIECFKKGKTVRYLLKTTNTGISTICS